LSPRSCLKKSRNEAGISTDTNKAVTLLLFTPYVSFAPIATRRKFDILFWFLPTKKPGQTQQAQVLSCVCHIHPGTTHYFGITHWQIIYNYVVGINGKTYA
jgi:hypothetical protein